MDDFWIWLKIKFPLVSILMDSYKIHADYEPQEMLVGYMIQYLYENKLEYSLQSIPVDYCFTYLKSIIETNKLKKDKENG